MRRYTPGSNLWYARLAWDRLLMDQLQAMVDPEWRRSFDRMERRAQRDYGQGYWWRPGRSEPSRGPEMGAAAER